MEREDFIRRLTELRMNRGVSAREMSLSIGQSPNYINTIENDKSMPSMIVFFYICEYLGITPKEFFDVEAKNPTKISRLENEAKGLNNDELNHILEVIKDIKRYKKAAGII